MSLYDKQIALENEYSTASLVAGQKQVLYALKQGRATDIGAGRLLLANAYAEALDMFIPFLEVPTRGVGGKFKRLLRIAAPEVLVMAALREVINGCASPEPHPMQSVLRNVGRILESESMLACMEKVNETYTQRTVEYLDSAGTRSTSHRYRTFLAGSRNMGLNWEQWSQEERIGAARQILTVLYEATGLFKWVTSQYSCGDSMYYLAPSDVLSKHFDDVQAAARAIVKYPPMLVKPIDWKGQSDGGYLTDWFRNESPMCGLRYIKKEHRSWIIKGLEAPQAQPVRDAMNKAQSVPYRINTDVLAILRKAVASRQGILGLPSHLEAPKPVFSLGADWDKANATEAELDVFKLWKQQMAAWYTAENKRKGRSTGIVSRLTEMTRYKDEAELYFPTFIDWRGRMYFRSNLNPQSSDAVKGCLEFAQGKVLGADGLYWLKVHVANCCGYDKHSNDLKAKWTEDNWNVIEDFINNPLDVDAPEPDTAFTLLQAGLALQAAISLQEPESFICHVPVAMDATCSGLQHLSALTRDPVGAYYTNLIDNNQDKKSDIYMQVASIADQSKLDLCTRKVKGGADQLDQVLLNFWQDFDITRNMAKKPVMTFVYGSTLLSTLDTLALDLSDMGIEPIRDQSGKVLYSLNSLALPVGKALRKGVNDTVPESAKMMKFLQSVVRRNSDKCMQWVTPVGVPVVNWAEGMIAKVLNIRSMGVQAITMNMRTNEYNTRSAANGIVPNFVHSMDSAHLCATINDFNGQVLPIHDSFATHPSDVTELHKSLRSTFVDMYKLYDLQLDMLEFNDIDLEEFPTPPQGNLDLEVINQSRYMFC